MKKEISVVAPLPKGRRFVVTDIHGCSKTFLALLDKISLNFDDQLFILGDSINRGKHSKSVVKIIMQLQNLGVSVFSLRGNHEHNLLQLSNDLPNDILSEYLRKHKLLGFISNKGVLKKKYREYFENLPYYCVSDKFHLVHAGFDFDENPFSNVSAMVNIRQMDLKKIPINLQIIHGHTPIAYDEILRSVTEHQQIIGIDNGCMMYGQKGFGNLICLNLDDFKIVAQPNIDC